MALLWFDGFEGYDDVTRLAQIYGQISGTPTFQATGGRRASRGIRCPFASTDFSRAIPRVDTVIAGVAIRPGSGINGVGNYMQFIGDNLAGSIGTQIQIRGETDGNISVRRGENGTQLGITSSPVVLFDDYVFVEARVVLGDAPDGSVELRVNGVTVVNVTAVDTKATGGNTLLVRVGLGGQPGGENVTFDDFYILNESGSGPANTFLSDVRVDRIVPIADGALSQFPTVFPASPTTQFDKIDEALSDDETSFIVGDTLNQISTFAMEDIPAVSGGATVYAVQINLRAQKLDEASGQRSARVINRVAAVNNALVTIPIESGYTSTARILETNPATISAWGEPEVDALELGLEVF